LGEQEYSHLNVLASPFMRVQFVGSILGHLITQTVPREEKQLIKRILLQSAAMTNVKAGNRALFRIYTPDEVSQPHL
jgi:hypothetical protein